MADTEELETFLRQPSYLYEGDVKDFKRRDWTRTNLLAALTRKAFVAKTVELEPAVVPATAPREIDAAYLRLSQLSDRPKELIAKMREMLASGASSYHGDFSYRRLIPAMQKGKDAAMVNVRKRDQRILEKSAPDMALIAASNNAVNALIKLGHAEHFAERMFPKYMRPCAIHACKPDSRNLSTLSDYESECYTLAMALCEWKHPFAMLQFLACDDFRISDMPATITLSGRRNGPIEFAVIMAAEGFNTDVAEGGATTRKMVRHVQEVSRLVARHAPFDLAVMGFVESVQQLTRQITLTAIEIINCIVRMVVAEKDKSSLKFINLDTKRSGRFTVNPDILLSAEMPPIYYQTVDPLFENLTRAWEDNLIHLETLKMTLLREYGFEKLSFGTEIGSYERMYQKYALSHWSMCTNRAFDDIAPAPRMMDLMHEKVYPAKFEEFYFALLTVPFPSRGKMSETDRKTLQARLQREPTNRALAVYV